MPFVVLAWLIVLGACASAPRRDGAAPAIRRADALVLQGCYRCLTDARDLYAQGRQRRRPQGLVQRLFETEVLIALRERELAMDATTAFDRARALAAELPPGLESARLLRLAEAVPPDDTGTPREHRRQHTADHRQWPGERIDEELNWLDSGSPATALRRYLSIALACSYKPAPRTSEREAPAKPVEPPLLAYRAAICIPISREPLERLAGEAPWIAETALFLGRLALPQVQADGGRKARELMRAAYAAFPLSTAATYLNGSLDQMSGDCRTALGFFNETLARQPLHEDALLGRTVCLSVLGESDAALSAATRLIDMRADNQGDAFYWRAWNHRQRDDLKPARGDIERAKTLRFNSSVLTLAGMIEHDQDDLATADTDLSAAIGLDASNCAGRWYSALVGLKREAWTIAATGFAAAMDCYRTSALDTERRMRTLTAREDLDPAWRAAQIAGFEAAVREDRSQESASAYNAAVNYLRGGNRKSAMAYADLAARDPSRLAKIEELRKLFVH